VPLAPSFLFEDPAPLVEADAVQVAEMKKQKVRALENISLMLNFKWFKIEMQLAKIKKRMLFVSEELIQEDYLSSMLF
jgi:hypothetical protein